MRVIVRIIDPQAVIWLRMAIALLILIPFIPRLLPKKLPLKDLRLLIPLVLFQPCLYFLFESNALRFTTSTQAGVISAIVPVLVAAGALLYLSEKMSFRKWTALGISIAGVAVMTLAGSEGGAAENPVLGNSLEVGAMIFAAGNMLLVKRLCDRYSPWTLTAFQVFAGFLFFLPGIRFLPDVPLQVWSMPMISALVFMGSFVTIGAFGLYNWGMSRVPAARASAFINLIPVVSGVLGWTLLKESLNLFQFTAAIVVVAGVWYGQEPDPVPAIHGA